jgi:hypothetical protein
VQNEQVGEDKMSDRKTAYVAVISNIEPIENKDRIKYISLKDNGFQVIGSADLQLGQKVIYIEYDTIIAEGQEWAEFLRKRCYSQKYRGFRISAMKMAGVISYGLILTFEEAGIPDYSEGFDLSNILHVTAIDDAQDFEMKQAFQKKMSKFQRFIKKYVYFIWKFFYYRKPEQNAFPTYAAIKTDETRLQNLTYLFNSEYKGIPLYVTEKIDGQSATYSLFNNRFIISSRNVKQYDQPIKKAKKELVPENAMKLGRANDFIRAACLKSIPQEIINWLKYNSFKLINSDCLTVQGELAGPGIQNNKLSLPNNVLFIFNLFDPKVRKYYNWELINSFGKQTGIHTVPFKEYTTFKWNSIKEIEEYVKEPFENSIYPSGQPREGLVFRQYTKDNMYLPDAEKNQNGCFSFKVINPDFIIKD